MRVRTDRDDATEVINRELHKGVPLEGNCMCVCVHAHAYPCMHVNICVFRSSPGVYVCVYLFKQ